MKKQIILLGIIILAVRGVSQNATWSYPGSLIFNNPTTSYVGLGINPPTERLHVKGTLRIDGGDEGGGSSNSFGGIRLFKNGSNTINTGFYIANKTNTAAYNFQLNTSGNALNLWTFNGTDWNNHFVFTNGGHFTIGLGSTVTPGAYLHVKAPDFWPGFIVEHNSTTAAYGVMFKAKNNLSKSFVIQNNVGTQYEPFIVYGDGKTKIGQKANYNHTDALLTVDGKGVFKEVYVTNQNWADFVFAAEYKLPSLKDVEAFYKLNKHLPEIPSAKEVEEKGVSVGEMNKLLLQKIEELTIYLVEQQKEIDALKEKNK
jgi:hypothetical protein